MVFAPHWQRPTPWPRPRPERRGEGSKAEAPFPRPVFRYFLAIAVDAFEIGSVDAPELQSVFRMPAAARMIERGNHLPGIGENEAPGLLHGPDLERLRFPVMGHFRGDDAHEVILEVKLVHHQ